MELDHHTKPEIFKLNTKHHPIVIGHLYASWCGYCKQLDPHWKKMKANIAKKPYHPIPKYLDIESQYLGMLDEFHKMNHDVLNGQTIPQNGFPTIFRIKNGKIDTYNGERTPEAMEKWFMEGSLDSHRKTSHRGGRSYTWRKKRTTIRKYWQRRRTPRRSKNA